MAGQRGINIPNFSALNQFVDPMAQAGKFAAEYGNRVRADERYQAEQARLKVLDDRATEAYNLQKATRQGIIDTEADKSNILSAMQETKAAEDPRFAAAMRSYETSSNYNPDGERLSPSQVLAMYGLTSQPSEQKLLSNEYAPTVGQQQPLLKEYSTGGVSQGPQYVYGTKQVQKQIPGQVVGDPTVSFNTYAPSGEVVQRPGSSRLNRKLNEINTRYDKLVSAAERFEPASSAYTSKASEAISRINAQRDAEIQKASTMPKGDKILQTMSRKLSDINITDPIEKNGQVYFGTKDGKDKILATTVGKVMQDNFKAPTVETTTVPIRTKVPSIGDITKGAPVFRTSEQTLMKIAQSNNTTPQAVQGALSSVGNDYKSILAMLGTDNTNERNELQKYLGMSASARGLLPSEYDVGKAVDSILPKNDLTSRQQMAINISLKELDNIREDKRWNDEREFKNMQFAWQQKMDQIGNRFKEAGLAQNWAKINQDRELAKAKAPEGYIRLLDGSLVPEAQAKAAWSKSGGKAGEYEAMTPAEKIMQQEEQVSKMQDIIKKNTGWLKDVFESDETQRAAARTKLGLK